MNIKKHLLIMSAALTLASCGGNSSSSSATESASAKGSEGTSEVVTTVEESSEEPKSAKVAKSLHAALQSYTEKSGLALDATLNLGVDVAGVFNVNLANAKLVAEGFHDKTKEPVVVVEATDTEPAKTINYFQAHLGLSLDSLEVKANAPKEEEVTSEEENASLFALKDFALDAYLDGNMVYANTEKLQLDTIGGLISMLQPESQVASILPIISGMLSTFNNKICLSFSDIATLSSVMGGSADATVTFDPQALVDGYDSAMAAIKSVDVDTIESIVTLLEDHIAFDAEGNGYKATLNTTYDNLFFFASMLGNTSVEALKGIKLDDIKNALPGLDETGFITCTFGDNGISNIAIKVNTGVAIAVTEEGQEPTYNKVADINFDLNVNVTDCLSLELPDFSGYTNPFAQPTEETSEEGQSSEVEGNSENIG